MESTAGENLKGKRDQPEHEDDAREDLGSKRRKTQEAEQGKAEDRPRGKAKKRIGIYVANITIFGEKAISYFEGLAEKRKRKVKTKPEEDEEEIPCIHCFQETHVVKAEIDKQAGTMKTLGWKSSWAPAQGNFDDTGSAGGVMTASNGIRMDHTAKVLGRTIGMAKGADVWMFKNVSMGILHTRGSMILVVNLYNTSGIGFTGDNVARMAFVAKLVKTFKLPYIVVGDWNLSPEQLLRTKWLETVGGRILKPPVAVTCAMGSGSLIDYAVVDKVAATMVQSVEVDTKGSWKPHLGYTISLEAESSMVESEVVVKPKKFAHFGADPEELAEAWKATGRTRARAETWTDRKEQKERNASMQTMEHQRSSGRSFEGGLQP